MHNCIAYFFNIQIANDYSGDVFGFVSRHGLRNSCSSSENTVDITMSRAIWIADLNKVLVESSIYCF